MIGSAMLGAGLFMAVLVLHFGQRPAMLEWNVFAIHSAFFKSESFHWIRKNMSGEISMMLSLAGLCLIVFSREAEETRLSGLLRVRALSLAVLASTGILLFSAFTVFGVGFVYVLVANAFATLLFAAILFRLFMWRANRRAEVRKAP